MTITGAALIWWFLREHRNWVWAYFESVMTLNSPAPDVTAAAQAIASASISSLTTVAIAASTTIAALVIWFVTGNVLALQSMFKWSSAANTIGTTTSNVDQVFEHKDEIQRTIQQFADRYKDDPSYAPIKPDTEEAFR